MTPEIAVWKIEPGSFVPIQIQILPHPSSLDHATRQLPGGAYTTLRTYHGNQVLRLNEHFLRLQETALLSGGRFSPGGFERDWNRIRPVLREAVAFHSGDEKRIRIILDLSQEIGAMYVLVERLSVPAPEMYENGVSIITRKMQRQNPKAKLTNFVEQSAAVRQEIPPGINEVLMVSQEGELLEGLSSNFFGIRTGQVFTADAGVLNGITRKMVIEVIQRLNIPIHFTAIQEANACELNEAFITSASRAVLPVTLIDGRAVGNGRPGDLTRHILAVYLDAIERELETI